MNDRFLREGMLLGEDALLKLNDSHVAVFGLGGVGSWCAEALARSGVGRITLVDSDVFSKSNINRQIGALESTIGEAKTDVMAKRVLEINPEVSVTPIHGLYSAAGRDAFFSDYDYVADCIDLVSCKLDLIESCMRKGIPLVSALGTGNKTDASMLCITDISKTKGCAFARVIRKELRNRGIDHLNVVYSPEESVDCLQIEDPPPGRRSVPGSLVWVPATAGLLMAQHIIMDLTKDLRTASFYCSHT